MVCLVRKRLASSLLLLFSLAGCRGVDLARPGLDRVLGSFSGDLMRSETRQAWDDWASARLEDGDILFDLGDGRLVMGLVNFSRLASELADSNFSHVAIVAREDGQVLVYDTGIDGPQRCTFGEFLTSRRVRKIAAKRLRPEFRQHIPAALAFCREIQEKRPEFDLDLKLDNDRLYCTELVELAFRSTGLPLSEPVRIDHLPRFDRISKPTRLLIQAATNLKPDQVVFLPGNEKIGIWSCPYLELVLDTTDVTSPPLPGPDDSRLSQVAR